MASKKYLVALAMGAILNNSCSFEENRESLNRKSQIQESQDIKKYSSIDEMFRKDELARSYRQIAKDQVILRAADWANCVVSQVDSTLENSIEKLHDYVKHRIPIQKGEIADMVYRDKTKRIAFYTVALVDEIIAEKLDRAWQRHQSKRHEAINQVYHILVSEHKKKFNMYREDFKNAIIDFLENENSENLDDKFYLEAKKNLPEYFWTRKWFEHHIMKPFTYNGPWSQDRYINNFIQSPINSSGLLKLKEKFLQEFIKLENK